jgi:NAD(P)-dependent dehydrogenase (short-subunit alcohol dehydrogenase family)
MKVAIVTGASHGIGAGLVAGFRAAGYAVVGTARSIDPSDDPEIVAVPGDIAEPGTAERVTGAALDRFGRIDTLVNNAGVFIARPFTDDTPTTTRRPPRSTWPGSSTSRSARSGRWSPRAPATSSTSPRASSPTPTTGRRRRWRR